MQATRKKLSCVNCSQDFWVRSPADRFNTVTLEECEFPDYDIAQTIDCDNCYSRITLYWHNEDLERKHLVEVKELSILKAKILHNLFFFFSMDALVSEYFSIREGDYTDEENEGAYRKESELMKEFVDEKLVQSGVSLTKLEQFQNELLEKTREMNKEYSQWRKVKMAKRNQVSK